MIKYIAFHNDPALQSRMLAAVDAHVKHDQVVQATYGTGRGHQFRGCFIGCTIHALSGDATRKFNDVDRVFDAYGFPPMLTRLCERIFEGLPSADAPVFFKAMPNALNLGADISLVVWKFLHWMVVDTLEKHGTDETRKGCADAVAVLLDRANGIDVTPQRAADAAAAAAADARWSAAAAAAAAADAAAADAAARWSAAAAADARWPAAAHAAADAARWSAAADAATADAATRWSAAAAADAAAAAADARWSAAARAAYQRFAAKLVELIGEAK